MDRTSIQQQRQTHQGMDQSIQAAKLYKFVEMLKIPIPSAADHIPDILAQNIRK